MVILSGPTLKQVFGVYAVISSKLKMELTPTKNLGQFPPYFIDLFTVASCICNIDNGELFHCQTCDVTVHRNDEENHCKGREHKYKTWLRGFQNGNFYSKLINSKLYST